MTEWIWATETRGQGQNEKMSVRVSFGENLKQILYREQANWFLWLPVALALGSGSYFALLVEPSWGFVLTLLIASAGFVFLSRKHTLALIFSALVFSMAAGFAFAKINTFRVAAPVIEKRIGPVAVAGRIETLLFLASGEVKIIIRPSRIERLKPEDTPGRIRLKLRQSQKATELFPGMFIEARAIIFPPPEPTYPGGFDFARKNWFEGIGGSGFFISAPKVTAVRGQASLFERARISLAHLRQRISSRLQSRLDGEKGGLAAALIVGDRAAISKSLVNTLRDAGLAHLLAISGLHMVLFAGTIFWLLRALLALNATLLLHWPVKKWAAGGALAGAFYYLLISGAAISTQRAFIMIAIMFIAIMLDRPAISLRNIAIAAVIILVIRPYSLLSVSFQMSFAATTMLVAFYEWFRSGNFFRFYPSSSLTMRALKSVCFYVAGTALTTLIAGLATSPFAAYYFQHIAVFSLLANILALPVIGFVVMPAGLVALLAMPLGVDGYVLPVMGAGLDLVIDIASWTVSFPDAVKITPAFSGTAMLLMIFGALWLCLWRTKWRFLGLAVIAAGLAVTPIYPLPDIYIAASGKNIAVRGGDGLLVVAKARREKFSVEKWLAREGDTISPGKAARRDGFRCDAGGCIFKLNDNRLVSFAETLAAVEEDCRRVDILIATVPVRLKCERPEVVIDKFDLWRNGAYTLTVSGQSVVVRNGLETRGDRPWVRKRGGKRRYDTKK